MRMLRSKVCSARALACVRYGYGITDTATKYWVASALDAIDEGFVQIKDNSNPFMKTVGAAAALRCLRPSEEEEQ